VSTDLQAVVEEAYAVFSQYRPIGRLTVCNCDVCMDLEMERVLERTPLREISSPLLAEYTNSAHGYDDEEIATDLRYFLPRYFELIAAGDPPDHLGLNSCLRRLGESSYRTKWPAQEADVIDRFFDAFLIACTAHLDVEESSSGWEPVFDITDALTLALTAGADVERLIRAIESAPDPGAAVHIASLRWRLRQTVTVPVFDCVYLEGEQYQEAAKRLAAWLSGTPVRERIEAAFFMVDDPRLQGFLSSSAW